MILLKPTQPFTLDQIPLPDKEIENILNTHSTLSITELLHGFQSIINQISTCLELVHLSVFTLEQNIKDDNFELDGIIPLETAIKRLEPVIKILSDLEDILFNKGDDHYTKNKITKLQSEWSSLQHFLASVQKQFALHKDNKELAMLIDSLMLQIDDVSAMIFHFQEKKHMTLVALPTSSSSDSERTASESTATTTTTDILNDYNIINEQSKWFQNKDDQSVADIDHAFDSLLQSIEIVYTRVATTNTRTSDNQLNRKLEKLKERWECLQNDHDDLKYEHKEDRWLTVFRRVADQVDVMIDGLDRSVVQCYSIVQQTRDWHASSLPPTPTSAFDKFSKTLLRPFHHSPKPTSPPVDKEKFRAIEKSFEAKYKYYTPSIDRMLGMLGSGISARATRDNTTAQRHDSMIQRWNHLKEVMDELRTRDLVETEKIISYSTSVATPEKHMTNTGWKGIKFRTPEPTSQDIFDNRIYTKNYNNKPNYITSPYDEHIALNGRGRSTTPNSGYGRSMTGSPNKIISRNQQGVSSPSALTDITLDYQYNHALLRSSTSDSSSTGSFSSQQPPHTRNPPISTINTINHRNLPSRPPRTTTPAKKDIDFYDEDERNYGVDLMKVVRPPSALRNETTIDRRKEDGRRTRAKTPNFSDTKKIIPSNRSKSSMGDIRTDIIMSPPLRRSITPSLIPRPRTATMNHAMASTIPRPKSSLRNNKPSASTMTQRPPLPDVRYHDNEPIRMDRLRKKQSTPMLKQEISVRDDYVYRPDPKDLLDVEVGRILNACPITIKCQKSQPGRYYFGDELSVSSMAGKKLYTCKLMTYNDRRGGQYKNNKVLIRVGGGWQDLEFFLLEHSSLMASEVVVRSFVPDVTEKSPRSSGWKY